MRVDLENQRQFTAAMRTLLVLGGLILLTGCFGKKASPVGERKAASAGSSKLVVTPEKALVGKVALVNLGARFVVLNFPLGRLPVVDQRLSLYRAGLKVADVRITGPQYDDNIVADLVTGDCQVGDQARDQ